jgi:hypothetical protein
MPCSLDFLERRGGREGPQQDTTLVRVSSIAMVGGFDWDSPPADVLQLPDLANFDAEGQDVGVLSYLVFMPKPSTHRMHDSRSILPYIQPQVFIDNQLS